jgi:hypothetical protein
MFTDFSKRFLVALYKEASVSGDVFESGQILSKYDLHFNEGWVDRVLEDWRNREFIQGPATVGGELVQPLYMTGRGFEQAERLLQSGVKVTERLPDIREISLGRAFMSENAPPEDFGQEGDVFLQVDGPDVEAHQSLAPAADRVVRFDDNLPERIVIAKSFVEIQEAVRSDNSLEPEERERVSVSLEAARTLWQASQIKVIQIKIGVLMAAEDAAELLKTTAKAVAAALLVDAIKSFIKNYTGIDLDQI